jgi:hypothetical protein
MKIRYHFDYLKVFFVAALTFTIACNTKKITPETTTRETTTEEITFLPSALGNEFPPSRYLSMQEQENLRPTGETKGGYDPTYRMLAFRRLENIEPNPPVGEVDSAGNPHLSGLRPDAKVIRIPQYEGGDTLSSKQLIDMFLGPDFLASPFAKFSEIKEKIKNERRDVLSRLGERPRVVVSGLGPVGLLTALESYLAGSSVIAIEQRSQYTRPQILRLTTDTIDRVNEFLGEKFWGYLRDFRGVVSKSPNWAPNKFDLDNPYLYKDKTEQQALATLSPAEQALRKSYDDKGLELKTVDIIRINHLETLLAAVLEKLAMEDPEHLRIYYGGTFKISPNEEAFGL